MVSATTSTGRRYRREIYLTIDGNAWEDHGCQGMRFGPSVWINGRLHHALAVEVMFVQQSDDKGANVLLEPAHEDNRREFDGIQALWSGFSETVDIEGVPYVVAIVPADGPRRRKLGGLMDHLTLVQCVVEMRDEYLSIQEQLTVDDPDFARFDSEDFEAYDHAAGAVEALDRVLVLLTEPFLTSAGRNV